MPSLADGVVVIISDVVFDTVRSKDSCDSVMESVWVCIERVSLDLRDSAGEASSIAGGSTIGSGLSLDLVFPFAFSDFSVFDERLNIALKVGALGFNFGVVDLDD